MSELAKIIAAGEAPEAKELQNFIASVGNGVASDREIAEYTKAVFENGLDAQSTATVTTAMAESGTILDWSYLNGPIADKHSSGGVGDLVSLVLAPAVAACGVYVPMISGRGLGHSGGTLDKLESAPGFSAVVDLETFQRTVEEVGCAIVGQTASLAPADGRIYAVRDVTGTVASVPLITASILSKKLAGIGQNGNRSLVMDIKYGSGAFMKTTSEAKELAASITAVANAAGLNTEALLTPMDQPLAPCAGNAIELRYAIDVLQGRADDERLMTVVVDLGAKMLTMSGVAETDREGRQQIKEAIRTGQAGEKFLAMMNALGSNAESLDELRSQLPSAGLRFPVIAERKGFVTEIDTEEIGWAVVHLGGGRTEVGQEIDHSVGITDFLALETSVLEGDILAVIHADDLEKAAEAAERVRAAYTIRPEM